MKNLFSAVLSFILGVINYLISLGGNNIAAAILIVSASVITVSVFLWKAMESKVSENIILFVVFALITLLIANLIGNPNWLGWGTSALVSLALSFALVTIMGYFKNASRL